MIPSLALKKLVAVRRHATAKEPFSEPVDYKRFRNLKTVFSLLFICCHFTRMIFFFFISEK